MTAPTEREPSAEGWTPEPDVTLQLFDNWCADWRGSGIPLDALRQLMLVKRGVEAMGARLTASAAPSEPPAAREEPSGFDPSCTDCCDPVIWCYYHNGEPPTEDK